MIRLLGLCVAFLGIASLVFGIVFVVMSGSVKAEVIDEVAEESYPIIVLDEAAYPYLNISETDTGIVDTEEEIDAFLDTLSDARHKMTEGPDGEPLEGADLFIKMFSPSNIDSVELYVPVDTLVFHEYMSTMGFSGSLGRAPIYLRMADLTQLVGIVSIIVGVALMLVGLLVFKLARQ